MHRIKMEDEGAEGDDLTVVHPTGIRFHNLRERGNKRINDRQLFTPP